MAKIETYCTHCGSLVNIDDKKDVFTCIFCGKESSLSSAMILNEDEAARKSLQSEAEIQAKEEVAIRKEHEKNMPRPGIEDLKKAAAQMPKEQIVIKPLSLRTKIILSSIIFLVVVLIAGVLVPSIINRNNKRNEIDSAIGYVGDDKKSDVMSVVIGSRSYENNSNTNFVLSIKDTIDESKAREIFDIYARVYSEVYSINISNAKSKILLSIYEENGKYSCQSVDKEGKNIRCSFTEVTEEAQESTEEGQVSSKDEVSSKDNASSKDDLSSKDSASSNGAD